MSLITMRDTYAFMCERIREDPTQLTELEVRIHSFYCQYSLFVADMRATQQRFATENTDILHTEYKYISPIECTEVFDVLYYSHSEIHPTILGIEIKGTFRAPAPSINSARC